MQSEEIHLQMKTRRSLFEKIQREIEHLHTYDLPEIIMVPMAGANLDYLQWIEEETINP